MNPDALYYLVGRKRASHYQAAAMADAARLVVIPDQVQTARLSNDRNILVDIDLSDPTEVLAIKRLKLHDSGREKIFLVASRSRSSEIQAKALGATRIVSNASELRLPAARPAQALPGGAGAAPATRVAAVTERSVAQAAGGLKTGLDGVLSGRRLDVEAVIRSSESIIAGIRDVGVSPWLDAVRQHHMGTYQHCLLVTGIASAFATKLGLGYAMVLTLTSGALLHDVGKAKIPLAILDKPSVLTPEERTIMNFHTLYGSQYLQKHSDVSSDILAMVRSHHELLDGTGYPDRLTAAEIPRCTRILTIADIFGALVEKRSYKPPMPAADAYVVLTKMAAAGKLDATLVERFAAIADEMD